MKKRSRPVHDPEQLRERIIGLGDSSQRKSYYPSLQQKIDELQQEIQEREQAQKKLASLQRDLSNIINSMPSVLISVDAEGCVTHWNAEAVQQTGLTIEEAQGQMLNKVAPYFQTKMDLIEQVMRTKQPIILENEISQKGNKPIYEAITIYPLTDHQEEGAVIRIDNITEKVILEQQLMQSSKMDAIGQLAGGVAHDFNNMLGGIFGAIDLLEGHVDSKAEKYIRLLRNAAEKAADLTSSLLVFSRKGTPTKKPIDLHKTIQDAIGLLQRSLDKKVEIYTQLDASLSTIEGDDAQLQNTFLNLGINAAHAMPNGGQVRFISQNGRLTAENQWESTPSGQPSTHIQIQVEDTGCGIASEHINHIFEPFFTTKERGKGTGLGLSAVYGIVKNHQGTISVQSQENIGTRFQLIFPIIHQTVKTVSEPTSAILGNGTILVVDDEAIVRKMSEAILKRLGYQVILAADGQEAIDMYQKHRDSIDLVLMDMIMPHMNGREALMQLKQTDSQVKVIIASGFSREEDLQDWGPDEAVGYIRKPYSKNELSRVLAQYLNEPSKKE